MITVIRCSALTNWPDCPRRGAARLFRQEITEAGFTLRRTPPSIGASIGTAVHRGAAAALDEKAKTGRLPPENVATDAAVETLRDSIESAGEMTYDSPRGATHNRAEAESQTVGMTKTYQRSIAPKVEPILWEQKLEAEVAPGVILSGHPDIVCREPRSVRDLKTGARSWGSHAPQLGGYSLLARSNAIDIDTAAIDFVQRVPVAKPQPEPISTSVEIARAETAASSILAHIIRDLAVFRHGDPDRRILPGDPWAFAANPASNLCAEKWCPAWGSDFCHEWRAK
jgi:hypothetical protein